MASVLGAHRLVFCCPLLLLAALVVLPAPGFAVEPPPELRYVCVDARDVVHYAQSPRECGSRETVRTLPDDGPVHWCADQLGRLVEAPGPGACGSKKRSLTVPDDGVMFVCAGNIRGGTTLARGELRTVIDVSHCDPDETGMVTPAAPEGVADDYSIDEDTQLVVPDKGVLDNDLDLTGAPLTANLVAAPPAGAFALEDEGGFRFDPRVVFDSLDAGESATTTFTYVADDGALTSDPTPVTITVQGRNDRPLAVDDVITTDEDTVVQATDPGILGNDTDAESHPLTSVVADGPALGDLTLGPNGSLRFDPRADFQHLGASAGDDDTSTFTYVARDGSSDSDTATVRIEVAGVNDTPVGGTDTLTTDENTALNITPAQLLGNDTDAEGQPLSVSSVDFPASGSGGLDVQPDGTLRFDPDTDSADPDGSPDFDHLDEGQQALVELTYRADDGALTSPPVTVSIVVRGLSAPTATDDARTTSEDLPIAIDLLGNDAVRGGTLALDLTDTGGDVTAEDGGVVRYDPRGAFDRLRPGDDETDTFRYVLTNGEGSSTGTVTVSVTGSNDAPVATADSYQVAPGTVLVVPGEDTHGAGTCSSQPCDVLANDDDVDNSHAELTSRLVAPPDRGRLTLAADGGFSFDPAGEFGDAGGQTTFTYRADDGTAESATTTVTLAVSTNQQPDFADDPYAFTLVVTAASGAEVGTVAATDADGDTLSYSVLTSETTAFALDPTTGVLTVGGSGPPAPGTYQLSVAVSDGHGGSDTADVTVRVVPELNAVDDVYVAVGNTELVGGTPAAGSFTARAAVRVAGLLANDGGATATVTPEAHQTAEGGSVEVQADGSFVYMPPPAAPGEPDAWDGVSPLTDSFDYHIEGDGVADANGTVTITVLHAVWYVDNAASAPGSGTAWAPFSALAALSGAGADTDLPGQTVFLFGNADPDTTPEDESAHPGGIALEDGQSLVGQASGLSVAKPGGGELNVVAAGPAPRVTAPAGVPAVGLASDNDLRGFVVGGAGHGIVGTAPGALTADLTTVRVAGDPIRLVAGDPADPVDVHLGLAESTGAAGSVRLDGLRGSLLIDSADLGLGGGIAVDAAPGLFEPVTLTALPPGDVRITAAHIGNGRLVVSGNAGSITVGDVTGAGASTGVDVTGNTGTVDLGTVHLSGLTGNATGIAIADDDGTTSIGGGWVKGDSESLTGALLGVTGVADSTSSTIDIGADLLLAPADQVVTVRSGRSVDISGVDGTVEVSGSVVDRGLGIEITDVPGTARLTGNVDAVTGATPALYAARVDTLELPPGTTVVKLSGATAAALHLEEVGIGGAGAVLDRVDSTGAAIAASSHTTGAGIVIDRVAAPTGAGLRVQGGSILAPAAAGVTVIGSSGVTLRGLLINDSAGDGIVVEDTTAATSGGNGLTLDGLRIQQPDLVGIDVARSGDLLVDGTTVSSAGSYGVRLDDPRGLSTVRGSTIEHSRDTQLLVEDGAASTGQHDLVVLDSSVVNGAEPEDDSIRVSTSDDGGGTGPANLEFRVAGTTPSGSIGGNVGLHASAASGSRLHLALSRLAVADTAGDAIRFTAAGAGAALTFALSTMDNSGGGGVQLARGAGIRATGDGTATIGGSMTGVKVVSTDESGIVLDRVSDVTMDIVGVQATGRHGIEIDDSARVDMDQVEIVRPSRHGLRVFQGTDVSLDDSRVDMRPPPPATFGDASTYDAFSAVWMRHLGGTGNAVTDTTLRGSTGDQLVVLEGMSVSPLPLEAAAPAGAPMEATVTISGLTATETALDPHPGDTVVREGDAVKVVAGTGADLTVDLSGTGSTRTDESLALTAERGGALAVTGGHPIVHDGAEGETDGADDSLRMEATGSGAGTSSTLGLGIAGLAITQVAPADAATQQMPGSALVVEADNGGSVTRVDPGAPSLSDSTVRSVGARHAVEMLADGPGSTLALGTTGLDVDFLVPAGFASPGADAVSIIGKGTGVVSSAELIGGTIRGHAGEAIDVRTEQSVIPQPFPPDVVLGHGSVGALTIDGVAVVGGAGDPIKVTGKVGGIAIRETTVTGGGGNGINVLDLVDSQPVITVSSTTVGGNGGHGISVAGPACVALDHNDTAASGGTGYVLQNVGLAGFRDAAHPTETVAQWLARLVNTGPPPPTLESHTPEPPGKCTP